MNGAESLVHTLLASDVKTCFANPGTSEMHFVAALDRIPGMRCILGLTESVVTGAADDDPVRSLLLCTVCRRDHSCQLADVADQALRTYRHTILYCTK